MQNDIQGGPHNGNHQGEIEGERIGQGIILAGDDLGEILKADKMIPFRGVAKKGHQKAHQEGHKGKEQ